MRNWLKHAFALALLFPLAATAGELVYSLEVWDGELKTPVLTATVQAAPNETATARAGQTTPYAAQCTTQVGQLPQCVSGEVFEGIEVVLTPRPLPKGGFETEIALERAELQTLSTVELQGQRMQLPQMRYYSTAVALHLPEQEEVAIPFGPRIGAHPMLPRYTLKVRVSPHP